MDDVREVQEIRYRLGWAIGRSQKDGNGLLDLERRAGLTKGELRQIQRKGCARVSVSKFRKIAAVLDVRLAWLLVGDNPAWFEVKIEGSPLCLQGEGEDEGYGERAVDGATRFMTPATAHAARRRCPGKMYGKAIIIGCIPPWRGDEANRPRGFSPRKVACAEQGCPQPAILSFGPVNPGSGTPFCEDHANRFIDRERDKGVDVTDAMLPVPGTKGLALDYPTRFHPGRTRDPVSRERASARSSR